MLKILLLLLLVVFVWTQFIGGSLKRHSVWTLQSHFSISLSLSYTHLEVKGEPSVCVCMCLLPAHHHHHHTLTEGYLCICIVNDLEESERECVCGLHLWIEESFSIHTHITKSLSIFGYCCQSVRRVPSSRSVLRTTHSWSWNTRKKEGERERERERKLALETPHLHLLLYSVAARSRLCLVCLCVVSSPHAGIRVFNSLTF